MQFFNCIIVRNVVLLHIRKRIECKKITSSASLLKKSEFQKKSIGSGAVDVIADSSEFAFRKRYMTDRKVVSFHPSLQNDICT